MIYSTRKLYSILLSILAAGLMAFGFTFSQAALAADGGGGSSSGGGSGRAKGLQTPGQMRANPGYRGPSSGPSVRSAPAPRMPSSPAPSPRYSSPRPSVPSYQGPRQTPGQMRANPNVARPPVVSAPQQPTSPRMPSGQGPVVSQPGRARGLQTPGQMRENPAIRTQPPQPGNAPGIGGSQPGRSGAGPGPAPAPAQTRTPEQFRESRQAPAPGAVGTQPGRARGLQTPGQMRENPAIQAQPGQPGSLPGTQVGPADRSGAGPATGQTRTPGQYREGSQGPPPGSTESQPGRARGLQTPGQLRENPTARTQPGQGPGDGFNAPGRGWDRDGQGRGPGGRDRGNRDGDGFRPGETNKQWKDKHDKHGGDWKHHGDWDDDDHWDWNDSFWSIGFFYYPGYSYGFNFGYWGFDYCGAYCAYSPFYYYGLPYVYAPRAVVVDVPVYTYREVPDYSYGSGYYLSQGSYSGLDAAMADIRNGWINGDPNLLLKHIGAGTQVAIYLDNNYAYSLSGSDYRDMVSDAVRNIRTINFTINNVEQRSDGAYTVTATHEFYDVNNQRKVVDVDYTLAQQGGSWVITSAGSDEMM